MNALNEVQEAGLLAMAKKYIQLQVEASTNPIMKKERELNLTCRWEYENMEGSWDEDIIGISVGVWRGMQGDQKWDQWIYFSVSSDSESEIHTGDSLP